MGEQSPAFSFYPRDFILGAASMTLEERGAYIWLMSHQWDRFSVPGDDMKALGAMLGVTPVSAKKIWAVVGKKFVRRDDGAWQNERVEAERRKQAERRERLAENGRQGGRPPQKARSNQQVSLNGTKPEPTGKANENQDERLSSSSLSSDLDRNAVPDRSLSVAGEAVWNDILQNLQVSDRERREWFTGWRVLSYQPGQRLELNAPSSVVRNWVNKHEKVALSEAVQRVAPDLQLALVYRPMSVKG